ncbi:unnamed protein product [Lymnaea stagnalis]|uniref:Cx9C motif-containing protein 4, mitochondrial n=1 Tax=Lymnaea stagnalis TaxID=6523 RepID=A0AAV2H711_LYMST
MPRKDPCQKYACDLQTCLQANDYQEWHCEPVLQALYDCCARSGYKNSDVCSGITVKETSLTNALKFSEGRIQPDPPTLLEEKPEDTTIVSEKSNSPPIQKKAKSVSKDSK